MGRPQSCRAEEKIDFLPCAPLCLKLGTVSLYDLIHTSNKKSHEATANQCYRGGCDHHNNDAPSHVDQKAQATSDQDLSQLHHAGEGGAVQALPSSAAGWAPFLGLLLLQGKHKNSI